MKKKFTYFVFLSPILYIIYQISFNLNIINPLSYIIISTGYISLSLIIFVLSLPIINNLTDYLDRRSLGFVTFFYALVHFIFYIIDNSANLKYIIDDLIELKFIQFGYLALILFLPLLFTSTDRLKKKLGKKWIAVHRLLYLILLFSIIHYYLVIKADYLIFALYLVIIALVFLIKFGMIKK